MKLDRSARKLSFSAFFLYRCWVGKRHLDLAAQQVSDKVDLQIKWLPYQLNPHMVEEGIPMEKYYREKFGEQGAAMARDMNATRFGRMGTALVDRLGIGWRCIG